MLAVWPARLPQPRRTRRPRPRVVLHPARLSMPRVPLTKLHPAPWNPRTIKDERFKNLCRSLEADPEFMVLRPVLATKDGLIYAGNMRFRAAQHLGWTDIEAQ